MTWKNWVSKLQMTTEEQVSQAQVTQVGLGSSTQKGKVPGKGTMSKASPQVPKPFLDLAASSASSFLGNQWPICSAAQNGAGDSV